MYDEISSVTTSTLHLINGLFSWTTWVSRCQKGKTSLDLSDTRDGGVLRWQWHQLDHMQTIWTLLQTYNHTNTSSLNVYRPDALPDAQPTVSKALEAISEREQSLQTEILKPTAKHVDKCGQHVSTI